MYFVLFCSYTKCLYRIFNQLNILSFHTLAVSVVAKPPSAVSFNAIGKDKPILYIAFITSSGGITLSTPAKAISAAAIAFDAPAAFLFMHGTSTSPATGSHESPSMFLSAIAIAFAACLALPPNSSTSAAAAIPLAEPTSAWHPPAAPEIVEEAIPAPEPVKTEEPPMPTPPEPDLSQDLDQTDELMSIYEQIQQSNQEETPKNSQ